MGPTSSGKTTIGEDLNRKLRGKNILTIHYDGDEVRDFFGSDFGFGGHNRLQVVKTLVYLANKAVEAGLNVVVSALTANDDARSYVQSQCCNLITAYIKCSISTCADRDPKGLYKKAQQGEIKTLIGFHTEYLAPSDPDVVVETETASLEKCSEQLIKYLSDCGNIPPTS